jgi:hypothetical protein
MKKKKWLTNYLDEMNLLKEATVKHCVASLGRLFHSEITTHSGKLSRKFSMKFMHACMPPTPFLSLIRKCFLPQMLSRYTLALYTNSGHKLAMNLVCISLKFLESVYYIMHICGENI